MAPHLQYEDPWHRVYLRAELEETVQRQVAHYLGTRRGEDRHPLSPANPQRKKSQLFGLLIGALRDRIDLTSGCRVVGDQRNYGSSSVPGIVGVIRIRSPIPRHCRKRDSSKLEVKDSQLLSRGARLHNRHRIRSGP